MTRPLYRPSPWLLLPAAMALFLLAYAHRDPLFPSACFLSLVSSYFHTRRASLPKRYPWVAVILGGGALYALCFLYYHIWLLDGDGLTYFRRFWYKPWVVSTNVMFQATILVWIWHLRRESTGLIFLCLGLIAISSGNLLPSSHGIVNLYALLGGACLLSLFILSGAMNGGRGQQLREQCWQSIVVLACIAIVSAGTWYLSTGLQHAGQLLDTLLADFMSGSNYHDAIGAGDIHISHQRHVRLSRRVVATLSGSESPAYLRTQVMVKYEKAPPDQSLEAVWLESRVDQPLPASNGNRSPVHSGQGAREVHLHVNLWGALPLPYNTARVHPPASRSCFLSDGATVHCSPESAQTSYTYEPDASSPPVPYGIGFALSAPDIGAPSKLEESIQQALTGPAEVFAQLRPLAREIVGADVSHALAAAQRIQNHFRKHYTYSLHVDLDEGLDPIVDFVRHRRPAYCEYFASGMALMLRAIGIPARVVGGFVVWEYNALLNQWMIRQRDAHAWVEVYDDQSQRWVGFDATPPFQQETFSRTGFLGFFDQSRAWIEFQIRAVVKRLYQIDFIGWLIKLRQLKTWFGPLGLGLIAILFIGVIYGLWRRFFPSFFQFLKRLLKWPLRQPPSKATDPIHAEAQHHFAEVAALLKQHGIPILPTETLEDYLQRLQLRETYETDGPQWAEPTSGSQMPLVQMNTPFLEAIANFSHAYHQLRFRPSPSALVELESRRYAIRATAAHIQHMQSDRAAIS